MGLTNDGQIDFGVARLSNFEIDATFVNAGVFFPNAVHFQLGRLFVGHEMRPFLEHFLVRPLFRRVKVPVPGVDTATNASSLIYFRVGAAGALRNIAASLIWWRGKLLKFRSSNWSGAQDFHVNCNRFLVLSFLFAKAFREKSADITCKRRNDSRTELQRRHYLKASWNIPIWSGYLVRVRDAVNDVFDIWETFIELLSESYEIFMKCNLSSQTAFAIHIEIQGNGISVYILLDKSALFIFLSYSTFDSISVFELNSFFELM